MKPKQKKLKNGLSVIVVPMKDNPTVTVFVAVQAGSNYEGESNNGISHFLEHMVFKGTKKRPHARAISYELEKVGATHNAFTSNEYTGYYAKATKKHYKKLLDLISDMYLNPIFDPLELEKEKGVILEEINMYEDLPARHVWDVLRDLMYKGQPAGRTILGPKKNIKQMTREDFVEYRKNHYIPKATTVVVAGNVNSGEVFKDIDKIFGAMDGGKKGKKEIVNTKQGKPQVALKFKKTDQAHMLIAFRSLVLKDKKTSATEVLATALGRGLSSRLFHRLRNELGMTYYVRSEQDGYTDHGEFIISAGVTVSRIKEAIQEILSECKKLTKEILDEDELGKSKELAIGLMNLNLESSDAQAVHYALANTQGLKLKTPNDIAREIRKVTSRDVQNVAKEIFVNKGLNLVVVGPFKNKTTFEKILKI